MRSVAQLLGRLVDGSNDTYSGTSTNAGVVTDIEATVVKVYSANGLATFAVYNTDGSNSIDVEIWETPDPSRTFAASDGGDWFPIFPQEDGAGDMVTTTLAAGEKKIFRAVAYSSNWKVVVKSTVADSHGTFEIDFNIKG
jgi:hypothetical protein